MGSEASADRDSPALPTVTNCSGVTREAAAAHVSFTEKGTESIWRTSLRLPCWKGWDLKELLLVTCGATCALSGQTRANESPFSSALPYSSARAQTGFGKEVLV